MDTPTEVVHHINEITTDNSLPNLFLCRDENEHRIVQKLDKQFLRMFNAARYYHWAEFEHFDITKNRQDQLQEMVIGEYHYEPVASLLDDFEHWRDIYGHNSLTSMEQLWLAFVMKKRWGKVWDGEKEEWVK